MPPSRCLTLGGNRVDCASRRSSSCTCAPLTLDVHELDLEVLVSVVSTVGTRPNSSLVLLLPIFGHSANMMVLVGELLTCGGDFHNLCACNLVMFLYCLGGTVMWLWCNLGCFVHQVGLSCNHIHHHMCDRDAIQRSPWPSFLLSNGSFISWVVCWKPLWSLHHRHDIRCVPGYCTSGVSDEYDGDIN